MSPSAAPPPPLSQTSSGSPTRKSGFGRVLVLDDDQECLQLACTALSLAGFQVEGLDAHARFFERLEVFQPDAIVLDRSLPGAAGEMLAARVRGFLGPHRPAVIMWTADATRDVEAVMLGGLVNDLVVKCQQGIDVLVQRVINQAGWDEIRDGLWRNVKDATVMYEGQRSRPLTVREIDFLYRLAEEKNKGLSRSEGCMLLLDLTKDTGNGRLLDRVSYRLKRKLPPSLCAALLTVRGKGWRLELAPR